MKFDEMPTDLNGQTIAFLPLEHQEGSAAWRHYANYMSEKFVMFGLTPAPITEFTDYILIFDYGAGETRTAISSVPLYGQTGGGTFYTSGSVFGSGGSTTFSGTTTQTPTYGITGYMPVTRSETDRYFFIRLIDVNASTKNNIVAAYEGTVTSSGSSKTFEEVGMCMIDSLFQNFRGTGRGSATISMDQC